MDVLRSPRRKVLPNAGGDVADKTGIGEHEFGVGVFEDHTAHPVAGLKPAESGLAATTVPTISAPGLTAPPGSSIRTSPTPTPTASVHTSGLKED
jgi:hypothetical protein